jgi:hypothetical protein
MVYLPYECLAAARQEYAEAHSEATLRITASEPETLLDHLLYLPVLHLTRPSELYYYQGTGLKVLYGFAYKYLTVEHFLGEVTRIRIGHSVGPLLQSGLVSGG